VQDQGPEDEETALSKKPAVPTEAEVKALRAAAQASPCEETLTAYGEAAYLWELASDPSCARRAGRAALEHWRATGEVPPLAFVDRLAY